MKSTFATVSLLAASGLAATIGHRHSVLHKQKREAVDLPFSKIVAFGDDFTDNAEGSYGHGITGNQYTGEGKLMWGNGTFTDGQVAVSYLSQNLGVPIDVDYAFGSASGAEVIGSVCDSKLVSNTQVSSYAKLRGGSIVPDARTQVSNYTNSEHADGIEDTLHYFWTGNNDVIGSLGWVGRFTLCTDGLCTAGQKKFIDGVVGCMTNALKELTDRGAYYVLVPNIYPRHLAPWTSLWITSTPGLLDNYGSVIDHINSDLKAKIDQINKERGTQIMYYDANGWFKRALKDKKISGVQGGVDGYADTCVDGCVKQNPSGTSNWDLFWKNTVTNKKPDDFFWMTEVVPSTTVHKSLAADMKSFLLAQEY